MPVLEIAFTSKGRACLADVELAGVAESWIAKAKISGHPSITELNIRYRLGEYLSPMFLEKETLEFFDEFIDELTKKAEELLPR
jgi:hypothetical protein